MAAGRRERAETKTFMYAAGAPGLKTSCQQGFRNKGWGGGKLCLKTPGPTQKEIAPVAGGTFRWVTGN